MPLLRRATGGSGHSRGARDEPGDDRCGGERPAARQTAARAREHPPSCATSCCSTPGTDAGAPRRQEIAARVRRADRVLPADRRRGGHVPADARFPSRIGTDRAFSAERVLRAQQGPRKADETDSTQAQVTADPAAVSTADRTGEQWDMDDDPRGPVAADRRGQQGRRGRRARLRCGPQPPGPAARRWIPRCRPAACPACPTPARTAWVPTASPHGTHVAGTIAAADDGRGIAGVAPGVRIASVKVVDDDGFIFPEYAVCGLMWATANKMAVTNNSYFVDPWLMTCNRDSEHVVFEAVRRAVDYATQQGTLTVAAATNEGADLSDPSGQTADRPPDVSGLDRRDAGRQLQGAAGRAARRGRGVGGRPRRAEGGLQLLRARRDRRDRAGRRAASRRRRPVRRHAGGRPACVLSTVPGGYDRYCGTSMATPHVDGRGGAAGERAPGGVAAAS